MREAGEDGENEKDKRAAHGGIVPPPVDSANGEVAAILARSAQI
jgi:hypothetical protein